MRLKFRRGYKGNAHWLCRVGIHRFTRWDKFPVYPVGSDDRWLRYCLRNGCERSDELT